MRSSACMFSMVSATVRTSPSERSACMGPCSSLFITPRESSSTALRSFFVRSPILPRAFSSSDTRMSSAIERRRLMVGTVSSESLQLSKVASSSASTPSAILARRRRSALLASTTSLRSSTLYTAEPSRSATSAPTLRGTEMSTYRRTPSTAALAAGSPAQLSSVSSRSVEPDATNTKSDSPTTRSISGISWMSNSTSGKSSASASARGMLRLSSVTFLTPLLCACFTSRRLIVPAPMMAMLASSSGASSFICISSTAAEDTDTAPSVSRHSARARLPHVTACLNSPLRLRPNPSMSCPSWYTFFTCARIWPSPRTSDSRPLDTRRRCITASRSRSTNRYGVSSSSVTPPYLHIQSMTSRAPRCQDTACTYTSMRLQVERMPASSMWGMAVSSAMAVAHSCSGTATFSRSETGVECTVRPIEMRAGFSLT
mmetsp:Transcript_14162/g.59206  ORF Transcript_14162/g.59206 Transcript_14162/m.59206 type:complete len:430 (+) Transcript_14162:264-1553(+)